MTDIRLMTDEQKDQLNKKPNMTEPKAVKTKKLATKQRAASTPAYTSIEDATDEEVQAALSATRSRSEFSRELDALEVGAGKRIEGDINRLRQKVSVFAKKHGKKFVVRPGANGNVIIARVESTSVEVTDNGDTNQA